MPKMFIHAPAGTFTAEARAQVAAKLTDLGMSCERLAETETVRKGVWVFFSEHARDAVFSGGRLADRPVVALVVYALEGGLDGAARKRLISGATSIIEAGVAPSKERLPVYVTIQETPEIDWGMFGEQVSLENLRKS